MRLRTLIRPTIATAGAVVVATAAVVASMSLVKTPSAAIPTPSSTTAPAESGLKVDKIVLSKSVGAGSILEYVLLVKNLGESATIPDVRLAMQDNRFSFLTAASAASSVAGQQPSCIGRDATSGTPTGYSCTLGDIPPHGLVSVFVRTSIISNALQDNPTPTFAARGFASPGAVPIEIDASILANSLNQLDIDKLVHAAESCTPPVLSADPVKPDGKDYAGLRRVLLKGLPGATQFVGEAAQRRVAIDPSDPALAANLKIMRDLLQQAVIEGVIDAAMQATGLSYIESGARCWIALSLFFGRPVGDTKPFQPTPDDARRNLPGSGAGQPQSPPARGSQPPPDSGTQPGPGAPPAGKDPSAKLCDPPSGSPDSFHPDDCVYPGSSPGSNLTCPAGYRTNPANVRECLKVGAANPGPKDDPVPAAPSAAVQLSRSSGPVGTTFTATGSGFAPNVPISVTEVGPGGSRAVGSPSADADGNLSMTMMVASDSPKGVLRITFKQGAKSVTRTFTVT